MFSEEIDDNEEYYSPLDGMEDMEDSLPDDYDEGYDEGYYDEDFDLGGEGSDFSGEDVLNEIDNDYFDSVYDIDFSGVSGSDYKKSLRKVNQKVSERKPRRRKAAPSRRRKLSTPTGTIASPLQRRKPKRQGKPMSRRIPSAQKVQPQKPLSRRIPLEENSRYRVKGVGEKKLAKVIVPDSQKVIIKGASDLILSKQSAVENIKSIRYYKGKKLKPLIITITNNDPTDFVFELFNPSMPLDYLYSTSNNLNNRIQIAGGNVSYTDVLFNILANPVLIVNAQLTSAGLNVNGQNNQRMFFKNKNIEGYEFVTPVNLDLKIDTMQVLNDIIYFNIFNTLNRAFVPDGMDVIEYKVLAGMSVTITFWYSQVSLKKFFYEEARKSKSLL